MLEVNNLETGYGGKQVLYGLSVKAAEGKITAVIGPNGSGKSTLLKTILGLVPVWQGEIIFNGEKLNGSNPAKNVARGITFSPQGNRVFNELTVKENLEIGGCRLPRREVKSRLADVIELFPSLKNRLKDSAGVLSGGEQQMVSIARALMAKPRLLMLDEPSLGLSPKFVKSVFQKITKINKDTGVTILIVEQKVRDVLKIADAVFALKLGKLSFDGKPAELINNQVLLKDLFL
jgi:ABC-type branched-subunit amino acid transport system ATPase component